ncbi:hypothetical protein FRC04_000563 [Tulasnella sp. 424]|nr:hypothetical protein FRC04_000563 [Tulasnella sp. 424]KAG8967918.1 hypothetical protein FRC05_001883 [Tulasnella sp. 425]
MPSKAQSKTKPGAGVAEISPSDLKELQDNIVKRLIQTGEWDRHPVLTNTYSFLPETARQQQQLHFKSLMTELVPNAEATVPAEIKEEILSLIRKFIEENTSST